MYRNNDNRLTMHQVYLQKHIDNPRTSILSILSYILQTKVIVKSMVFQIEVKAERKNDNF